MPLERVLFGGRFSLDADELTPFDRALIATDCYVDDGAIRGRNGYRPTLSAAIVGSGTPQHLGRFRPALTSARTVAVIGGEIWVMTDPTSNTASDGTKVSLGTVFGSSSRVSGCQLGRYYYLGSDGTGSWRRIKWTSPDTYSLEDLSAFTQGSKPTSSLSGGLTWTQLRNLAAPTITGVAVYGTSGMGASDWRSVTATGANDDPVADITVQFNLGSNFDARAYDWLAVTITPRDRNNPGGQVDIYLARDNAGSPADYTLVGSVYDVPPVGGSPNIIYCPLTEVPVAVREAVRYVKFVLSGNLGGKFGLYGYLFLPKKSELNPQRYYVTFYNSSTGQESPATEALEVTMTEPTLPTYPNVWLEASNFKIYTEGADMLSTANRRIFNREAGKAMPTKTELGAAVTISGTTPAYTGPDLIRLWKDTQNGRRLVTTAAYPGASTAYAIVDNIGDTVVLANTLYKAGGTPPSTNAMAAHAQRIVSAKEHRVSISSYLAPGLTSDPYPQFPAISLEDSDGWSFDIAPAADEQVIQVVRGDVIYIITNKAAYVQPDLTPNSPAYEIINRGGVSRFGAIWAEQSLFWASWDGIYQAVNRSDPRELTREFRRTYVNTFAPDNTVTLGYQARKLLVYKGNTMLRYDFVRQEWTGPHTLTDSVTIALSWPEPSA